MNAATTIRTAAAAELGHQAATVMERVGNALERQGIEVRTVRMSVENYMVSGLRGLVSVQVPGEGDVQRAGDVLGLGAPIVYAVGPEDDRYNLVKREGDVDRVLVEVYCREGR